MKKFNKNLIVTGLVISFVFIMFGLTRPIATRAFPNPATVNLLATGNFAILAGTPNITDAGNASIIVGNIGLSPATSFGIKPFCSQITGTIYGVDAAYVGDGINTTCFAGNPPLSNKTLVDNAKIDLTTAYGDAAGRLVDATVATELGGTTKTAGVYTSGATTFQITAGAGPLVLDGLGDSSAVFIFKMGFAGTGLTVGPGSIVSLINGAQAKNVFWQVDTATIDTTAVFKGNILALNSITVANGANVEGRLLARNGNVTLDHDTITIPTTLRVIKVVNGGTAVPADFIIHVKNSSNAEVGGGPFVGTSTPGTSYSLVPDTYVVSENVNPLYTPSFSGDCNSSGSVTLTVGQNLTCTITNNNIPPSSSGKGTINVVKTVINDNGGTKTVADFPLFVNGTSVISGETNVFSAKSSYVVTETADSHYTRTFSGDCDINGQLWLTKNENAFCIITNNDIGAPVVVPPVPPLIDVIKVPEPLALPAGPGLVKYTYTLRNIGTVPVTNITMVGDTCSPIVLASGDINADAKLDVNETWVYRCSTTLLETHTNTVVATGWANGLSATDIASANVVVGVPAVVPPLIHVTKVPSPLTLSAGGGMVTYTEKITNPGTVALSNVHLTDDKCSPMKYISGDTNSNSKLDTTETWTYACRANLTKTTTNTAVASGEANGLTARDFAIAAVTVATAVPTLPKTGLAPEGNSIPWNIITLSGIFAVSIFFYLARRKQTN